MLRSLTLPIPYRRSRHFSVNAFAIRSRLRCFPTRQWSSRIRNSWWGRRKSTASLEQDFFEEIYGPLVAGLPEPEDRLFADGGVGVGLGDFDEQRDGLVFRPLTDGEDGLLLNLGVGARAVQRVFQRVQPAFARLRAGLEDRFLSVLPVVVLAGEVDQEVDRGGLILIDRGGDDDLFLDVAMGNGSVAVLQRRDSVAVLANPNGEGRLFAHFPALAFITYKVGQELRLSAYLAEPEDGARPHFFDRRLPDEVLEHPGNARVVV